jgi:hypothetical protein
LGAVYEINFFGLPLKNGETPLSYTLTPDYPF